MAVNITITNNKPVDLVPVTHDKLNQDFDAISLIKEIAVDPIRTPLVAKHPVKITANGGAVSDDEIVDVISRCCDDTVDAQAEEIAKTLYSQALANYNNGQMNFKSIFAVQSGVKSNLPEPSDVVVYTPAQDVIPMSRKFLAGTATYDELFASFAFYAQPNILGFYFANAQSFEDFKAYFATAVAQIQAALPVDTQRLCSDFQSLTLNELTESIAIRDQQTDNNEHFSFARLITNQLMAYTGIVSSAEFGVMPFDFGELIVPKSLVFINIEKHSRSSSNKVAQEWKIINDSLKNRIPMVSMKKLNRLTAVQRNINKIQASAATAISNQGQQAARSAHIVFRKTEPNSADLAKLIKKLMDKMAYVNKSMNIYKSVKSTFNRPNRRDPDDYNKTGKAISTKYKPDIHLYIDTSGSISERNYQDAVKACIHMAKKLNVNLYFNSFSHVLSQGTKLNTKDKSMAAIYKEFQKVPKVTGGTNFELVWDYINRSKQRKREISILMTDFEWSAPNHHIDHPKNLYYIPCSHMDWNYMCRSAEYFIKSMVGQVPNIRRHVLF